MSLAFDVVFGVFVVAIVALAFLAIRWGVRRDRVARARQSERSAAVAAPGEAPVLPPSARSEHRS
jgi:hypothetical protein